MTEGLEIYLENVFRNSTSPDEIFDAVNLAVQNKVDNIDLYKILLANPTLSKDELIMFTEKICREFVPYKFDLYVWIAKLFESNYNDYHYIENSLHYYQKAFLINPENELPLLSALNLYNYDLELPINKNILQLVNTGEPTIKNKSVLYNKLSEHFGKTGNYELKNKYAELAAKYSRKQNQ